MRCAVCDQPVAYHADRWAWSHVRPGADHAPDLRHQPAASTAVRRPVDVSRSASVRPGRGLVAR